MNATSLTMLMTFGLALLLIATAPVMAQEAGPVTPVTPEPSGLLLTWMNDPASTMTIDWHTTPEHDAALAQSQLQYREMNRETWQLAQASKFAFPFSDRTVHRSELTGLKPDTLYQFRVGGFSRAYLFRTMPQKIEPGKTIVFAIGGDTRFDHAKMTSVAMKYDPAFVVWGGDLAYSDGRQDRIEREYEWYDTCMKNLITEQGRVVPVVVVIGNHEVQRKRGGNYYHRFPEFKTWEEFEAYPGHIEKWRMDNAPYFYTLLAFPGQPGYAALDFGDYLSLLMLDSDHTNPIQGKQTRWLEKALQDRVNVAHVFPVYHEPAYPSVHDLDTPPARLVREFWTPLFDKYNVKVAFENHNHAYKRTPTIRNHKPHPDGVVYLGDGAWGVVPRKVHDAKTTWYLERAEALRNAIIVTLDSDKQRHFLMVGEDGQVIDEYPQPMDP